MECKTALKSGIIVVTMLVAAILTVQQAQQAYAQNAGYNAGKNDRMDGNSYNDICPSGTSDGDCALYKTAYFGGWNAEGLLHGNDQERDTPPDFSDRDSNDDDN